VDSRLINLDRSTDRLAAFAARNQPLLPIRRFPAIDGATVSRADLVERGVFAPDVTIPTARSARRSPTCRCGTRLSRATSR
jgi:hypothetical protein